MVHATGLPIVINGYNSMVSKRVSQDTLDDKDGGGSENGMSDVTVKSATSMADADAMSTMSETASLTARWMSSLSCASSQRIIAVSAGPVVATDSGALRGPLLAVGCGP